MIIYKIRNIDTGLYFSQLNNSHIEFSKCKWNKTGKCWNSISDIERILKYHKYYRLDDYDYFYNKCEVVMCEIIENKIIKLFKK